MLSFAGVLFLLGSCTAHMCLLNPPQRGGADDAALNTAASAACYVTDSPCGSSHKGEASAVLHRGHTTTVTFQKNADHWTKATPGYFQVNLVDNQGSTELGRVTDMGEPNLHVYTKQFTVPASAPHGAVTLQVIYVTNNPAAPPFFYQCADVMVQ